jgi:hypothetical protein
MSKSIVSQAFIMIDNTMFIGNIYIYIITKCNRINWYQAHDRKIKRTLIFMQMLNAKKLLNCSCNIIVECIWEGRGG